MSRRSRKRTPTERRGWIGKSLLVLLGLAILGIGVAYGMLRGFLHSDGFRKFLAAEIGDATGVTGEFAPFRWDGLAVETEKFTATGPKLVTAVKAQGLHTEVGFGGVRRGVWEIKGTRLSHVEISLDTRGQARSLEFPAAVRKREKKPSGWLPSKVEVQSADIQDLAIKAILRDGPAVASGMNVQVEQAGAPDAYRGELRGGSIRLPQAWLPEIRLNNASFRYHEGLAFVTNSSLGVWSQGRVEATGEYDGERRSYAFEGQASDIKCDEIFSPSWAKRTSGDVSSTFTISGGPSAPVASGQLEIDHGVLTALPVLDALAAYADTRRFRVITLDNARTDWRWRNGEITLSNLVLAADGLVRLEGGIVIQGRDIDGQFRLGLAPGTLASIPGAETDVFIAGERGLLWTPLRVTGTLDGPKEDLTDRLIAAAGMRMFDQIPETGERALKFTRSILEEHSPETLNKGVKIIRESSGIIREVSGVLDGFLGSPQSPEPEKQD